MKILVALDNEKVKNELIKLYGDIVYKQDITYMEGVIEFLSNTDEEYILITRDNLNGNLNNMLFAKQIKLSNNNTRVIYIVSKLTNEYKEFLFSNKIFNIIEGEYIDIKQIADVIENDKNIIYKSNEIFNSNQVIPKQMIAVFGTSGAGKSFISSIISKEICNELKISTCLIDMDIQNPSIDIFNNLEANVSNISQIVEDVDKRIEINGNINKYVQKDKNNRKLNYITNNVSLYDCQNKLSKEYYQKIYSACSQTYEYCVIDLPSTPFLDVVEYTLKYSTKIYFVINPNYLSIRQAIKYLDLMVRNWNIQKEKINIILNKIQKNSLDIDQVESLIKGYKAILSIEYNKDIESFINGAINIIDVKINTQNMYRNLGINNKKEKIKIINSFENLIKKRGNIK